ncbi:MAG: hypothetical protein IT318_16445 [Anaerolineales bacterium]|nr:hypothetical protein [Anaerolineales bacterium]
MASTKLLPLRIKAWLQGKNIAVREESPNHWQAFAQHEHLAAYQIDIHSRDGFVTHGAQLLSNITGPNKQKLYEFALDLNAQINGAQIARSDEKIVLIRNSFREDVNEQTIQRDLAIFNETHEYVFMELLKKAKDLGLKIKAPN